MTTASRIARTPAIQTIRGGLASFRRAHLTRRREPRRRGGSSWFAPEIGIIPLLDGSVEGVHVHVDDLTLPRRGTRLIVGLVVIGAGCPPRNQPGCGRCSLRRGGRDGCVLQTECLPTSLEMSGRTKLKRTPRSRRSAMARFALVDGAAGPRQLLPQGTADCMNSQMAFLR